ncbi:cytochrome P450 [Lentinula detonsa]|uniref:Cytochrome P450 n=1 Tax=Lentinula detonsa TaxID=2804962 RepID=A0A9W8TTQ6_9AGAR|nr:cytochrome P450 [Lentinula detonsa]
MILAVAALLVLSLVILYESYRKTISHQYPLPPGPKKLPIVGNLFDVPKSGRVWLEYAELSRRYKSDIIHLGALGNSIVILNSARIANELLDKRSSIYSSRPFTVMLGELTGWGSVFAFRPNDDLWKAQRKIMNQAMPSGDSQRFHPMLIRVTQDLLRDLPHFDILESLHTWAAVLIMDATYGFNTEEAKAYLPTARVATESVVIAGTPGAFYVDQFPILKYLPEWFPGAGFKRKAREWSDMRSKMTEEPFRLTKERVAMGTARPSLASIALEQMDHDQDLVKQEEVIKASSVAAYGGGSDTTVTALQSFIWAMLMNPDVQTKAQHELDQVLGVGNLPSFNEEASLPYITAVVRETLRFNPVAPIAVPHQLTEDDIYEGFFLPKGSVIVPNVWSMLYSVEDYPQPHLFNPSRFLDANGNINPKIKDPAASTFGFGRRICPGRSIALASFWIAVASILSCYSIEPEPGEHGEPNKPQTDPGLSLLNQVPPFKCRFVPRSKELELFLSLNSS